MDSTTVEATSAASTTLRPSTGRPDGAGVLLVVADRVEALPEQHDRAEQHDAVMTAKTATSAALVVVIAPNR